MQPKVVYSAALTCSVIAEGYIAQGGTADGKGTSAIIDRHPAAIFGLPGFRRRDPHIGQVGWLCVGIHPPPFEVAVLLLKVTSVRVGLLNDWLYIPASTRQCYC